MCGTALVPEFPPRAVQDLVRKTVNPFIVGLGRRCWVVGIEWVRGDLQTFPGEPLGPFPNRLLQGALRHQRVNDMAVQDGSNLAQASQADSAVALGALELGNARLADLCEQPQLAGAHPQRLADRAHPAAWRRWRQGGGSPRFGSFLRLLETKSAGC